ncbi:hypothetical protein P7C71_g492, partial [Lecanoromycetidae sp. Uapishka_2]
MSSLASSYIIVGAGVFGANLVDKIFDNYKKLGVNVGAELIKPEELRTRFEGLFADTDSRHVDNLLWNPSSGWAEAARALEGAVKAAVENGVHYVTASIANLTVEGGSCVGVRTEDGRTFTAERIILSTGAYTAKLMADSAPKQPELQVGGRITACSVCEAAVDLSPEQVKRFKHGPAFVLDANETQGETMPPTPDQQLKFIRDMPLKNTVYHAASDQEISVPFTDKFRSQWTTREHMPTQLVREIDTVMKGCYGKEVDGQQPSHYRLCWCVDSVLAQLNFSESLIYHVCRDGVTQDNNWYICPHPRCNNLYIATAGSFHGWKFLPIVGEYVVQMLKGELPEEMRKRWEWDRSFDGVPKNVLLPERELRDIED